MNTNSVSSFSLHFNTMSCLGLVEKNLNPLREFARLIAAKKEKNRASHGPEKINLTSAWPATILNTI